MDINNIVASSSLSEDTQQKLISRYEEIKEYIQNLEENTIEAIEQEGLLGEIESLIKTFADHTFLDALKKEMNLVDHIFLDALKKEMDLVDHISLDGLKKEIVHISSKEQEITILNFRLGNNGLILKGFGPEGFETFISGDVEVEARAQVQYADIDDEETLEDLVADIDILVGIYLKEVVKSLLTKEALSKWNITYPIPVYYCEDFEEFYPEDGELLTTL